MKIHAPNRRPSRGFSLIEVTIAMAIAAVALVSLIGMIPQGMQTMRDAGDEAIIARIHQQILGELQLTPFEGESGGSPLDTYDGMEIYYDAQGEEIGNSRDSGSSAQGSSEHIYSARIHILSASGGAQAPESVGGSTFDGVTFDGLDPNPHIRPVIIEVAPVGGRAGNFDWDEDSNRSLIQTYQTMVVKTGQDYTP